MTEGEDEVIATDDESASDDDDDDTVCVTLPKRDLRIGCNETLMQALPGVVDLRGSDFECARKLAFK